MGLETAQQEKQGETTQERWVPKVCCLCSSKIEEGLVKGRGGLSQGRLGEGSATPVSIRQDEGWELAPGQVPQGRTLGLVSGCPADAGDRTEDATLGGPLLGKSGS